MTSKRAGLAWGTQALSSEWHDLIVQAIADRPVPWNDPPRPGSVEAAIPCAAAGATSIEWCVSRSIAIAMKGSWR